MNFEVHGFISVSSEDLERTGGDLQQALEDNEAFAEFQSWDEQDGVFTFETPQEYEDADTPGTIISNWWHGKPFGWSPEDDDEDAS